MRPRRSRAPLAAAAALLIGLLLTVGRADAQLVDHSGSGPLADRISGALQAASSTGVGNRYYVAFGFTGLLPSDASAGSGGVFMLQRADGWSMSGLSGLIEVRDPWAAEASRPLILDLATLRETAPDPAPTLRQHPMLVVLSGRNTSAGAEITGLNLRLRAGKFITRDRAFYWLGEADASAVWTWVSDRSGDSLGDGERSLRRSLVGLVSLLPEGSGAPEALERWASSDEDEEVRHRAIAYLGRRPEDTTAVLRRLYAGADEASDRAEALQALADRIGPSSKPQLMDAARSADQDATIRRTAISYLTRVAGGDVDGVLEALLSDPDVDIRRRAVTSWERREPSRAVPLLERVATQDSEVRVRQEAVTSLGDIEGDASTAAIRRLFDSSDEDRVRVSALTELVGRRDARTVSWLAGLARSDRSVEVRKQAVRHLGRMDDPAARQALEQILRNGGGG